MHYKFTQITDPVPQVEEIFCYNVEADVVTRVDVCPSSILVQPIVAALWNVNHRLAA